MPKNDLFSFSVNVGKNALDEVRDDNGNIFVGWDGCSTETVLQTLRDVDGNTQEYPLTPYTITLETFDRHLSLWFVVYVDGQQVSSRPILGAKKFSFSGIASNGFVREFNFTIPIMTENKKERLPKHVDQDKVGTIMIEAYSVVQLPGVYVPKPQRGRGREYFHATKNDKHTGVCTALGAQEQLFTMNHPKYPSAKPRLIKNKLLSHLILNYRPIADIKDLFTYSIQAEGRQDQEPMDMNESHIFGKNILIDNITQKDLVGDSFRAANGVEAAREENLGDISEEMQNPGVEQRSNFDNGRVFGQRHVSSKLSRYSMDKPNVDLLKDTVGNKDVNNEETSESVAGVKVKNRLSMDKPDTQVLNNALTVKEQTVTSIEADDKSEENDLNGETGDIVRAENRRSMAKPDATVLHAALANMHSSDAVESCDNGNSEVDLTRVKKRVSTDMSAINSTPQKEYIHLSKRRRTSLPHTVLSPGRALIKTPMKKTPKLDNVPEEFIVLDSDGEDDSVIWTGDDSCYFVDVDPEPVPFIDLANDSNDSLAL